MSSLNFRISSYNFTGRTEPEPVRHARLSSRKMAAVVWSETDCIVRWPDPRDVERCPTIRTAWILGKILEDHVRRRAHSQSIQLGVPQLAVVLSGLVAVAVAFWAPHAYDWDDLYYRDVVIPRMQESHGFEWGAVTFRCRGTAAHTYRGVVSVLPGGRFSRLGIRAGHVPFTRHGGGYAAMHHALQAAERRHVSNVDVVNAQNCSEGKEGFRTVALHP